MPRWRNYDHAERFGSKEDIDVYKHFVHPLPAFEGKLPDFPVSWGWHPQMTVPDNVSISGHFQSDKYFLHCLPIIRYYFTMKGEEDFSDYCAIHYRAGDYDKGDSGYHPRMKKQYYERAMSLFPANTRFLVFSDDITEAKEMFGNGVFYAEGNDYLTDFRIMKTCGSFIIANSSFSLMAAILGNHPEKQVICPSTWFGPAWNPKLETKDLYPENSIVI